MFPAAAGGVNIWYKLPTTRRQGYLQHTTYNPDCPGGWRLGDTQEAHLRHLDGEHEGERERGHDEDHGGQRDQDRAQPHAGVAACLTISTHAHTVDTER